MVKQMRPSRGVFCFYPPVYPPSFFDTFSQADGIRSRWFCTRILAGRGAPFKTQRSRPPPYPHPSSSQMGPPTSTCTVFRSNDCSAEILYKSRIFCMMFVCFISRLENRRLSTHIGQPLPRGTCHCDVLLHISSLPAAFPPVLLIKHR